MTDILRMDDGHRRWADVDRGTPQSAKPPGNGGPANMVDNDLQGLGSGVLQAEMIRVIAAIEVPPKEEVTKSIEWVSDRISSEAGSGLAAQANVVPPRALALLTD